MKLSDVRPSIVVVAGPNGAGKSTVAPALLHGALAVATLPSSGQRRRRTKSSNPHTVA